MKKIFNLIAVGMVLASVNVNARMPIMEMVVMYKSHRLLLLLHLYLIETFGEIKI